MISNNYPESEAKAIKLFRNQEQFWAITKIPKLRARNFDERSNGGSEEERMKDEETRTRTDPPQRLVKQFPESL